MNSLENNQTKPPEFREHSSPVAPPGSETGRTVRLRRIGGMVAAVIVVGFVIGFVPRWHQRAVVRAETIELATPSVSVVSPTPSQPAGGLMLPAEVKPLLEAPIFARANGYLKRWLVDIGAHVTEGQLLAEIDTPELNQQTRAGPRRTRANGCRPGAGQDHRRPLGRPVEDVQRQRAGKRGKASGLQAQDRDGRCCARQRSPAGGTCVICAGHGAICRDNHGAQYRCRRSYRGGQQQGTLSSRANRDASGVCARAAIRRPRHHPRPIGGDDDP